MDINTIINHIILSYSDDWIEYVELCNEMKMDPIFGILFEYNMEIPNIKQICNAGTSVNLIPLIKYLYEGKDNDYIVDNEWSEKGIDEIKYSCEMDIDEIKYLHKIGFKFSNEGIENAIWKHNNDIFYFLESVIVDICHNNCMDVASNAGNIEILEYIRKKYDCKYDELLLMNAIEYNEVIKHMLLSGDIKYNNKLIFKLLGDVSGRNQEMKIFLVSLLVTETEDSNWLED